MGNENTVMGMGENEIESFPHISNIYIFYIYVYIYIYIYIYVYIYIYIYMYVCMCVYVCTQFKHISSMRRSSAWLAYMSLLLKMLKITKKCPHFLS